MNADELVEKVATILMGRLMVSREDAVHIWNGMYEPEKEQFRREARAAIAVLRPALRAEVLEEAAKVADQKAMEQADARDAYEENGEEWTIYNEAAFVLADIAAAIRAMIPKE